jgi:hypothetical protein
MASQERAIQAAVRLHQFFKRPVISTELVQTMINSNPLLRTPRAAEDGRRVSLLREKAPVTVLM